MTRCLQVIVLHLLRRTNSEWCTSIVQVQKSTTLRVCDTIEPMFDSALSIKFLKETVLMK